MPSITEIGLIIIIALLTYYLYKSSPLPNEFWSVVLEGVKTVTDKTESTLDDTVVDVAEKILDIDDKDSEAVAT